MQLALAYQTDWPDMPGDSRWSLERASNALAEFITSSPLLLPVAFQFCWRGIRYEVTAQQADDKTTIRIAGVLGRVPFTSEDRRTRSRIVNILRHALETWPMCGLRFAGGEVHLDCNVEHHGAVSLADLATAASCALLQIQPALEIIESDLIPVE